MAAGGRLVRNGCLEPRLIRVFLPANCEAISKNLEKVKQLGKQIGKILKLLCDSHPQQTSFLRSSIPTTLLEKRRGWLIGWYLHMHSLLSKPGLRQQSVVYQLLISYLPPLRGNKLNLLASCCLVYPWIKLKFIHSSTRPDPPIPSRCFVWPFSASSFVVLILLRLPDCRRLNISTASEPSSLMDRLELVVHSSTCRALHKKFIQRFTSWWVMKTIILAS